MTLYADPQRCPDCRAPITPAADRCGACDLTLRGETAQRLFSTLVQADQLLGVLRAASAGRVGPPVPAGVPTGVRTGTAVLPAATATESAPRRRGLSAATVPKILLGLGAACLLVASLVFLAVAWTLLGVGGRTVALVALTGVAGWLAVRMARRGLAGAAEALALVGFGLLTLDLTGGYHAGWFGGLTVSGLLLLVGSALTLTGILAARWSRGTAVGRLTGAEVVVAVGTALAALGLVSAAWLPTAPSLVLAVAVAAGVALVTHRRRLATAAAGTGLVAAAAWMCLTGDALDRTLVHDGGWSGLWAGLEVWPLLAAASIAAAPGLARRLPLAVRVSAVAVGLLLLTVALLSPARHLGATPASLVLLGLLAVLGVVTRLLPRPWGLTTSVTQAAAATGVLLAGALLTGEAALRLAEATHPVWSGHAGDRLPRLDAVLDQPAGWLLPLCTVVLLGTAAAVAGATGAADRTLTGSLPVRVGAALLAGSLVAGLALYPVPVWLVVAALLATAAGAVVRWQRAGDVLALAVASAAAAGGLAVSAHADLLTGLALLPVLALALLVELRGRGSTAATAGALVAAALAGLVGTWARVGDVEATWTALAGLLTLGLLVLATPYAPARWWTDATAVVGQEVGAAAAALPLAVAGVLLAPAADQATWTAVYLTTAGVVVTLVSLLREDRHALAWVGGALLAAASWVRLWDLGVHAPEAYTLPSAVALLAVGLLRLRRDPAATTMTALAPGLGLALLPTLLWALTEPAGLRALLLGLACLLLVLAGSRLGWTAPVALGSVTGAVLVAWLAAPYVGAAVPRWVLLGLAGALLVAVGATWERRLVDARQLAGYVRRLR